MDDIDRAQGQETMQREAAIQTARNYTGTKLQHTGECHHCEAPVEAPKLFCDGKCAKRYELNKGR